METMAAVWGLAWSGSSGGAWAEVNAPPSDCLVADDSPGTGAIVGSLETELKDVFWQPGTMRNSWMGPMVNQAVVIPQCHHRRCTLPAPFVLRGGAGHPLTHIALPYESSIAFRSP